MPRRNRNSRKPRLRQFECDTCTRNGRTNVWWAKVPDSDPWSQCRFCGDELEAVPDGEWVGVGACLFQCDNCGKEYTVLCEWTDTAECYGCGKKDVSPCEFKPPRKIEKKTDKKHSCSKCNGNGDCPNLNGLRF